MSLRSDPELMRVYKRDWIRARRAEFFYGKVCVSCGANENLELDHVDRKTKVTHNIWSWSKQRRDTETIKCQILCSVCHQRKTSREGVEHHKHGMRGMYARGCRCALCRAAQYESIKAWRVKVGGRRAS